MLDLSKNVTKADNLQDYQT